MTTTPTPHHRSSDDQRKRDPRSQRSRDALVEAAADLLAESAPDDISITDVAQRAKLSRPTVYQHFQDKEAVLTAVIHTRLSEVLHGVDGTPLALPARSEAIERINVLVTEFISNHTLYRRLIDSTAGAQVRTEINRYLFELSYGYVASLHSAEVREEEELAHFITGGAIALLEQWSSSADTSSAEERHHISETIWTLIHRVCHV
ncbi:TetR/AcrR family transcriptional regulator [Gordonia polyisoprenivorans]|uniref:TetR/AcrR family transcriptional regulator n=1 Tax=Gordonia polyisoprenivorans TaxID=84595 RepID=UPI002301DAF3|nr:TetR/AcrR family transcriptional regulator [Gordonia polyisoprenivorans]WCB38744.1 TetR/AcrR family transcriptional regulator [Gordonia polyisoprenivorans]